MIQQQSGLDIAIVALYAATMSRRQLSIYQQHLAPAVAAARVSLEQGCGECLEDQRIDRIPAGEHCYH